MIKGQDALVLSDFHHDLIQPVLDNLLSGTCRQDILDLLLLLDKIQSEVHRYVCDLVQEAVVEGFLRNTVI